MSASFHELDESATRVLFERRARLPGERVGVPSLEAVLRAARVEARASSGGRRRAWGGIALAAASVLAVMKTAPHEISMVADVGAEPLATTYRGGGVCEAREVQSCSAEPPPAAATEPPAADDPVCCTPSATSASSEALCCKAEDPALRDLR